MACCVSCNVCACAALCVCLNEVNAQPTSEVGKDNLLVSLALVLIHLASPLRHRHLLAWALTLIALVAWLLLARAIRLLYLRAALDCKQQLCTDGQGPVTSPPPYTGLDRALLGLDRAVVRRLLGPRARVLAYGAACFGLASFSAAHDPSLAALFGLALPSVILGSLRWKHDVPTADPLNLLSFADGATVFGIITGARAVCSCRAVCGVCVCVCLRDGGEYRFTDSSVRGGGVHGDLHVAGDLDHPGHVAHATLAARPQAQRRLCPYVGHRTRTTHMTHARAHTPHTLTCIFQAIF